MSRPICKGESRWSYWRKEAHSLGKHDKFTRWAKRQMAKARRRFAKSTTSK